MPRKEFSRKTKRQAYERSKGKCEAMGLVYGIKSGQRCNADLTKGVEYDHVVRACDGGDNSLENCLAVCKSCHRYKTTHFDTPQAAKTKRMADRRKGIGKATSTIASPASNRKSNPNRNRRDPFPGLQKRRLYNEIPK